LNRQRTAHHFESHPLERGFLSEKTADEEAAGPRPRPRCRASFSRGDLAAEHDEVVARIVETPRNGPVRNLYRDGVFSPQPDGSWRRTLQDRRAA
jgi:hypothetical protein